MIDVRSSGTRSAESQVSAGGRFMQRCVEAVAIAYLSLLAPWLSASASGADWPMFGRDPSHNGVTPETKPPRSWDVGGFDRKNGAWLSDKYRNIMWHATLGYGTY